MASTPIPINVDRIYGNRCACHQRTSLSLNGSADQAAPLGPGAVVVAHIRVTEQVVQREPGVAAAFTDAAVGDDIFIGRNALATVDCLEFFSALEGTIFAHRSAPGDVGRARNVPAALRALLGQAAGSQQLAPLLAAPAALNQHH